MTAETAVTLPVVVLVLATVLATGQVARTHVACHEAARAAARALSRGDDGARVRETAQALLPGPVTVEAAPGDGGPVVVEVRTTAGLPVLGETVVRCRAAAWPEEPA